MRIIVAGTLHPHSALYQELLLHMPQVEIAGIFDDGGAVVAGCQGVPRYDSLDELIRNEAFEACLVTVPNDMGTKVCRALLKAGKHVLADKPVCRNAREMSEIVEAVMQSKVKFAVGYQRRFHPAHRRARELVQSGEIGRILAVQAHMVTTDVASRGPGHYLFQKERSGGGILHWLGCHVIDLVRNLVGCEISDVSCAAATLSGAPIDVEDVAGLSFRFENGAVGSLTVGYAIPFESDSPYRESPKDSAIHVWGDRGKLAYEPFGESLELTRYRATPGAPAKERWDAFALPHVPGYEGWVGRALVEDFLAAILEDRSPEATAEDNLRVLEVIDAAYAQ